MLRDRTFLVPALVGAVGVCGMFVYIAMASYVLQDTYGLSAQQFAYVFGANAVAILLAGRASAGLVGRVGAARLLTTGVVVALVAAVAMLVGVLVSGSVWVLLAPLLVFVGCTGVLLPNATALALDGQGSAAGTASAVFGLLQFAIGAAVPPLASLGGVTVVVMAVTILATGGDGLIRFGLVRFRVSRTAPPKMRELGVVWVSRSPRRRPLASATVHPGEQLRAGGVPQG